MATNAKTLVLFFISVLPFSSPTIAVATRIPPLLTRQHRHQEQIHQICNQITYPNLCFNSTLPRFAKNAEPEPVTLLHAQIEATSDYLRIAAAEAHKFQSDPCFSNPIAAEAIGFCKESYDKAIGDLKLASEAIISRDLFSLITNVQNIGYASKNCDDAFAVRPGVKKVMKGFDEQLGQLGANCLDLAHMLDWKLPG